jgi:bifunctional DNase/RNase
MMKEMKLSRLILDPVTNTPIIILKDVEDKIALPIWIGLLEASAIAMEIEKVSLPRPMTHDLFKNILDTLKVRIAKVEVTDLKENTFYALIHLTVNGATFTIDARPSDAIALALRASSPIYVDEAVIAKLEKANLESLTPVDEGEESAKWKDLLEKMSPEDFGKYKM